MQVEQIAIPTVAMLIRVPYACANAKSAIEKRRQADPGC